MQFVDLKKQQKLIQASLHTRMSAVLEHGKYIMGPEVKELEQKLAGFTGAKHCISCSSGTDALLMALMAKNVGPGDAIFTSPFTFIATAEVIRLLGATPVFVDICPNTYNIDPAKLKDSIQSLNAGKKPSPGAPDHLIPKGIIPVDIFGLPADYDSINTLAKADGLFVLEDAAQSIGAIYKNKRAGNLGDVSATSFFPAKPLGCFGDGGAVFTDDDALAQILQSIRVHGKGGDKYNNVRTGLNARMDTLQAAVLLAKLEVFEKEIDDRQKIAAVYTEGLKDVVNTPYIPSDCTSAWAQYSVLSDKKEAIMSALKREGIPTAVYYPKPLHIQTAFSGLEYQEGSMPVAETTSKRIFSLPMHPYLEVKDQRRVNSIIQHV